MIYPRNDTPEFSVRFTYSLIWWTTKTHTKCKPYAQRKITVRKGGKNHTHHTHTHTHTKAEQNLFKEVHLVKIAKLFILDPNMFVKSALKLLDDNNPLGLKIIL